MKTPVHVAVTGAAGQISYSLLFRLIAGDLTGQDQPIVLHLLEVPEAIDSLEGVVMELNDCASPLLAGIVVSSDPYQVFAGADLAFLVGARPRTSGMERQDLLQINAEIFALQGKVLNEVANPGVKVLVIGNPANTNALIAYQNAPRLSPRNFSAMSRLDHNRALSHLAAHVKSPVETICRVTIWGNHSPTLFADLHHAIVDGQPAMDLIDPEWFRDHFIPAVQQRGTKVIQARGKSSAASAANAAIGHMRDWITSTPENDWISMAVVSDGSYGIEEGLIYSFPTQIINGEYRIVQDLFLNDFSLDRIQRSAAELKLERDMIKHML